MAMLSSSFPLKAKIALAVTLVLWASAFAAIRAGLEGYSPGGLAMLRFLIASICMAIIYIFSPSRSAILLRDKILLLAIGGIGLGWYNVVLNYGELSVPSAITSFIIAQSPIVTVILAALFLQELLSARILVGMVISIIGVALITLSNVHQFDFQLGLLYVIVAMVISGVYSVAQKPFLHRYHALDVAVYIIWGAALMLLMYLPDMWRDIKLQTSLAPTLSVAYLGIFPAAFASVTWSYTLKEISASRAVGFFYLMPIIAIILGWVWLGEKLSMLSLVGGAVALVGVWLVNRAHQRKIT